MPASFDPRDRTDEFFSTTSILSLAHLQPSSSAFSTSSASSSASSTTPLSSSPLPLLSSTGHHHHHVAIRVAPLAPPRGDPSVIEAGSRIAATFMDCAQRLDKLSSCTDLPHCVMQLFVNLIWC
jgi:hypothetical protein